MNGEIGAFLIGWVILIAFLVIRHFVRKKDYSDVSHQQRVIDEIVRKRKTPALDIFKSQKEKLNKRFNIALDTFLSVVESGPTSNDYKFFSIILDRASSILDDYNTYLEEVADVNKNFDLDRSIVLHKKGLENPQKLSEKELEQFIDELDLILKHLQGFPLQSYKEKMCMALYVIFINVGAVVDEDIKEKYFKVWWPFYKNCLMFCLDFKYEKHLPKELAKLVGKEMQKR